MTNQQIPLDSIEADAPPLYKLNFLADSGGHRHFPAVDIAMTPEGTLDKVFFKFWGLNSYDIHLAFPKWKKSNSGVFEYHITDISYRIVVFGKEQHSIQANYLHKFNYLPFLSLDGMTIRGGKKLIKLYRALEHLPKLPNDWCYMQFVG